MKMFKINQHPYFVKKFAKLIKKNQRLTLAINKKVLLLADNPKNPTLKSHKVNTELFDEVFSSSITEDIRIIWRYGETLEIIEILELLDIGGHDEVY